MRTIGLLTAGILSLANAVAARAAAQPINMLAAENFYGDIARQIGGPDVKVTSILNNPNQDPHQFEASPSTARAVANAQLVIYNGAAYDPWIDKLLSASPANERTTIIAAALAHRNAGDNPHLWYQPETMVAVAQAIAAALDRADPANKPATDARLQDFIASLKPLQQKIAELRAKYAGIPVTATEPIFGYMADAIGLRMLNLRFQMAVMNETEPAASDVGALEDDLEKGHVQVLFYNSQTSDDLTNRLVDLAKASHVPVVGVTETEPVGKNYQQWMMAQLDALQQALATAP